MMFQNWGATPEEINSPVVGDELCPHARISCTRSISIDAAPEEVFPWIRQMGFGRAGWYSYDIIDNLGHKSATTIHSEWQDIVSGSSVPGGPIKFEAVLVDAPNSYVLQIGSSTKPSRLIFTLAYELRAEGLGTRVVTRMRARMRFPGGAILEKFFLAPGDGIMLRKQLLTLAQRASRK